MLTHCVMLSLRSDADPAAAMAILAGLQGRVAGMLSLIHGPNRDYEGKSLGYSYAFVISFSDRAALAAYDAHPEHRRAGAMLVAMCPHGAASIFVADIES